jgi:hypothetical protein
VIAIDVPNRPFATEAFTGLMLPDGIFITILGRQGINAQFRNVGAGSSPGMRIYLESVADPGIVVTPMTYPVSGLSAGASALLGWQADFSQAQPGKHLVSFIVSTPTETRRVLKHIFVTRVTFDAATKTFGAAFPEGELKAQFIDLVGPKSLNGGKRDTPPDRDRPTVQAILGNLAQWFGRPDFKFRGPVLPHDVEMSFVPAAPYSGQYGDLPFQDPWLKALFVIIAVVAVIASIAVEAIFGSGVPTVKAVRSGGGFDGTADCCKQELEVGGTSVVAGLILAAGMVSAGVAVALGDRRDPFRRGEDSTLPAPGEKTTAENLVLQMSYPDTIALGKPFRVGAKWTYTRVTTGNSYTHAVSEISTEGHHLSSYKVDAPKAIQSGQQPFIVTGTFYGPKGTPYQGDDLYVQCFLIGPAGQLVRFLLQDNGSGERFVDAKALDGTYTGGYQFTAADKGTWRFLVVAQDVNDAQPSMKPEQAAQIIGGIILTNQAAITFDGGTCPFSPDGQVTVG